MGTFADCINLENVVLVDGLKNIDEYAFKNCFKLKSIKIPKTTTNIAVNAFYNCPNLNSDSYNLLKERFDNIEFE